MLETEEKEPAAPRKVREPPPASTVPERRRLAPLLRGEFESPTCAGSTHVTIAGSTLLA